MKPTESFSEASLNFFNKLDVVFCYWRPNNTIVLYNWTHVDNKGTKQEPNVARCEGPQNTVCSLMSFRNNFSYVLSR